MESLEAGIRFFDLRYAALEDGGKQGEEGMRLVFWHKMVLLSEVATVEDVLFGFYEWLETRGKGETVMISLQYEVSFSLVLFLLIFCSWGRGIVVLVSWS